jgi:hypothetical protein
MVKKASRGHRTPRRSPACLPREAQEMLEALVESLALPDDACRRANVEVALRVCAPAVLTLAIDGLVARLGGPSSGPAVATLAQFGGRSLPAVTLAFTRTRSAAAQKDMVEVLVRIAPRLDLDRRLIAMGEAGMLLPRFAAADAVRQDLKRLVALLRSVDEKPSRAGQPAQAAAPAVSSPAAGG